MGKLLQNVILASCLPNPFLPFFPIFQLHSGTNPFGTIGVLRLNDPAVFVLIYLLAKLFIFLKEKIIQRNGEGDMGFYKSLFF